MDLSKLDVVAGANAGYECELLHPATAKPLGIFIKLRGHDSDEAKAVSSAQRQRRIDAAAAGKASMFSMLPTAEVEANAIELLAACTFAWRDASLDVADVIEVDGEKLPCTPDNVKKIYRGYPWIVEQVDGVVSNRANFITG